MNQILRVAVCDDERRAISIIAGAVEKAFLEQGVTARVETFGSAKELLERMDGQNFELLFLDIRMPQMDGMELGKMLKGRVDAPEIIFVSSNTERVFETFAIHPFGFVRKNKFLDDIHEVISRYVETMEKETKGKNLVHFKEGQGTVTLNAERVVYVECYRNVQTVHVDGQEEVVRLYSRMETLEQELRPFHFLRVHKGYLVNCRYVKRFDSKSVTLTTGETLPVGRQKRQAAMDEYMDFVRENGGYVG
jgi:DNA-binding LytR/AlgR family response regulator